jgi:dihydrofolate reductase
MGEVVLFMAITADGFVCGPDGEMDWLFSIDPDEERTAWVVETLWSADVHAMGGRTYRDMSNAWPASDAPQAPPMNEVPKVAFSKTIESADWGPVRIASGDLDEEVQRLKEEIDGTILVHGGAGFAQSLVAAGLVDEYRLRVFPVAIGKGKALFSKLDEPLALSLVDARRFQTGVVCHTYRPTP